MALPTLVLQTWRQRDLDALAARIQALIDAGLPVAAAERQALDEFAAEAEQQALRARRTDR